MVVDIYGLTLQSALGIFPYEAWYGIKTHWQSSFWGCTVYFRQESPKKLLPKSITVFS